ncbi:MAG: hypothetical protein KGL95_13575, partial [Patescibacteria group bacterium]|nr:hypothetical protein [Patescibacteria group bacterium]
SKCACAGAGIGMCLCAVFMSLSMVGTAAVSVSKNVAKSAAANMAGMNGMAAANNMTNMKNASATVASMQMGSTGNPVIDFFGGFWGEVILLISFGAMIVGIWTSRSSKKLMPIAAAGAAILYTSMYDYASIPLEILGSIVIGIAYLSAFSKRVAQKIRMT